jgi:hypothetical protein
VPFEEQSQVLVASDSSSPIGLESKAGIDADQDQGTNGGRTALSEREGESGAQGVANEDRGGAGLTLEPGGEAFHFPGEGLAACGAPAMAEQRWSQDHFGRR